MAEDHSDQTNNRIDEFARKYRLWFAIPLVIAAAVSVWNRSAALEFVIFMLCTWAFVGAIGLILRVMRGLLSQSISARGKAEILNSVGATLFLGGLASIGIVLRGENAVSRFVAKAKPDGFNAAFIDPTFAVVCIVLIWVYTAFRLRKER